LHKAAYQGLEALDYPSFNHTISTIPIELVNFIPA